MNPNNYYLSPMMQQQQSAAPIKSALSGAASGDASFTIAGGSRRAWFSVSKIN